MVLPYDPNNPYDPENASHGLMLLASATGVEVGPELQRVSLDINQPNWQRDATTSANMVENHESHLHTELDTSINYSYQQSLSAPSFSMSQSFSGLPSTGHTHEHLECESESRRPQPRTHRNKTCYPPLRKGGASNNSEGYVSVGGRRWPRRNKPPRRKRKPQPIQKYACPLYLQSREKHKRCKHCVLTSWTRVLQHLKRSHLAEEDHCPRCRCSFSSETMKDEHIRSGDCQPADFAHSGVFLEEDYGNLKFIRQNSDDEKWKEGWRRLFPDLPTPSPFYESDAEIITRTGRTACIKALQKAAQGHGNLPALADELLGDLTHALESAARGGDIDTTAPEVSQDADPAHNRTAYSPGLLGQARQVMRRTAHLRDLPEANPLMVPPQVPPDTPLSSQEQIFAQPQQIPPDLSGVEELSTETFQCWLPVQHPHSMTAQLPPHMLNGPELSLSQPSFVTPTNLHDSLYNDGTSFLSDEEMILDMAFSAEMREAN